MIIFVYFLKLFYIFIVLVSYTMNSEKFIFAPKIDAITPYGVTDKPSICGASHFINMKINKLIRTDIPQKASGVYVILSNINSNGYVGSAVNFRSRKSNHFGNLKKGTHHNSHIQNHYNLYSQYDLWFGIIEFVPRLQNEDIKLFGKRLLAREQFYIDTLKPEFNIRPIAGSPFGIIAWNKGLTKETDEGVKRTSEKMKDRKPSKETRLLMKKSREDFFETEAGKEWSKAQRKLILGSKRLESSKHKQGISTIAFYETEEGSKIKRHLSNTSTKLWQNPEYRKKHKTAKLKFWTSEAGIKRKQELSKINK